MIKEHAPLLSFICFSEQYYLAFCVTYCLDGTFLGDGIDLCLLSWLELTAYSKDHPYLHFIVALLRHPYHMWVGAHVKPWLKPLLRFTLAFMHRSCDTVVH